MKYVIAFLFMLLIFGGIGQLVGSLIFMVMRDMPKTISPLLLFEVLGYYREGMLSSSAQKAFFVSGGVAGAFMVLPPLLMMLGLLIKKKPSLHGDARFANDMELKPYLYIGSYK